MAETSQRTYRGLILTGLITAAGLAIFGSVARQTFLRYVFDLHTFVDDAAGITPGATVLLHGIPIGHVRTIGLSGIGEVRIDMRFSRSHLAEIPEDSTIAIKAANLIGDKALDISRGVHPKTIAPDSEIKATATQDIGSVLARGQEPLKKVDTILERIDRIFKAVNESQGSFGLLVNDKTLQKRLQGITAGLNQIQSDVKGGHGAMFRLHDIETDARKPMDRLNAVIADYKQGKGTLGEFMNSTAFREETSAAMKQAGQLFDDAQKDPRRAAAMKEFAAATAKARELTARAEGTQASLGLLLKDPALRDSMKQIDAEWSGFMTDFGKNPRRFVSLRFGLF
jgi:phospholipid/cholesterol/gamma-HCH transport system substrate-binding protein